MREMIKMIAVLAVLSTLAGGLLASVHNETREKIEKQILEFVQGPAIRSILEGASNDPINDRFEIKDGDVTRTFFVGVLDGEPRAVTLETFGSGFDGPVGLMVGFDVKGNKLLGAKVTTSTETPGMGARAKTDPDFVPQFKGLPVKDVYKLTQDGGTINALSGATITSRAVCAAASDAAKIYEQLKPEITEKLTQFKK